mmetsp:Transcript_29166/g.29560  ORF Transcript_29166/g.29560 Transcript_29166/m.29560 type:complete len:85 (-) Transcript_29166:51-305(-)
MHLTPHSQHPHNPPSSASLSIMCRSPNDVIIETVVRTPLCRARRGAHPENTTLDRPLGLHPTNPLSTIEVELYEINKALASQAN